MTAILLVGLGSAAGGMLRHWFAGIEEIGFLDAHELPWGTILVNLIGSALIGFLAGLPPSVAGPETRLLLVTGFCGGFTTFSSFSLQNILLLQDGGTLQAAWNVGFSVIAGLVAAVIGYKIGSVFG